MNKLFVVLVLIFSSAILAQNSSNDCFNFVTVSTKDTFTSKGSTTETAVNKIAKPSSRDGTTIWLKVEVTASGTLGFDIIPKKLEVGLPYSFWVYGPNRDCSNLGKPIRSCTVKRKGANRKSNNRIGMNGTTTTTMQTENRYVRWLDVTEGEFYYIRIDRPTADAGFDLQWLGSAVNSENTEESRSALASPPPPVGIIELEATISSSATAICSGNEVTITITGTPHTTVKYYIDSGAEQTIILDDSGTFSFSETLNVTRVYGLTSIKVYDSIGALVQEEVLDAKVTVTVQALPTATISGTAVICSGETTPVTFSGTPESIVTYNFNDGSDQQIVLDASGTATISATTAGTYTLVRVRIPGALNCSEDLSGSAVITVLPAPTVKITGATTICSGETATITLTGAPNSTVTYTFNDGAEQEIVLNALGTATLSTSTAGTYALVRMISKGALICTRDLTDSVIITVNPLPTAVIGGTTTICEGESADVTFIGTPNCIVTYTINGGSEEQITLNAFGAATISVSETGTYNLVRVTSPGPPGCSQALSDSATITVVPLPTAIITSTETICTGESGIITFTGTPLATITYTINGGLNQQVVLDASGIATLQTTTAGIYTLVWATTSGTHACTQPLTGATRVTIKPRPTAVITGTTTICSGETAIVTFTGTPNCTVTYTLNGEATEEIVLNATGMATLSVNETGTYTLVRVTTPGIPGCPQELSGSATVTVLPLPTATITSTETICSGETAIVTFTGTPLATVFYRINGGPEQQIILNSSGTGTVSTTTASTYTLVRVTASGAVVCSQNLTGATTITIKSRPAAIITGTATICSGESATITFAGTPNCRVVYTIDGGTEEEIVLNDSGAATLSVSETGTYTLVRVTTPGTPGCSQNLSGSATITVLPLPTATIAGSITVCSGETAEITFTGTPHASVTYTVDGGPEQDITLNTSGTGMVSTTTAGTYALVRVTTLGTPVCSQDLTGSATVTLKELPTATISGTTTVCSGETARITFTGTPLATVTYSINDQSNESIVLDAAGTATITSPILTVSTIYKLISIVSSNVPVCSRQLMGSHLINIIALPELPVLAPYKACNNGTNGYAVFDLTIKANEIKAGNSALKVTFHTSEMDANLGQNSLPSSYTSDSTTIYVRVQNTITGCYAVTTMELKAGPLPVLIMPTAPVASCDGNDGDGIGSFDLNVLIPDMLNGVTDVSVSFHETQENAQNGLFPITAQPYLNSNPWNQTMWVLAINTVTGCQKVYSFPLYVQREPILPLALDMEECDTDASPYDNQTTFDLAVNTAIILAAQTNSPTAYQVNYYNSEDDAEADVTMVSDENVIGTNDQTIWVRVTHKETGCYSVGSFKLVVKKALQLQQPDAIIHCGHTQANYEQQLFDITIRESQITGGTTGYTFNYYSSATFPPNATQLIPNPTAFLNTDAMQTLLIEVINNKGCRSYTTLTIGVEPLEKPTPNAGFVCIDSNTGAVLSTHTINSGLDATTHTFQWYKDIEGMPQPIMGATEATYEVSEQGVYSVRAVSIATGCPSLPAKVVIGKSEPAKAKAHAWKSFTDNQSVTVEVTGIGNYVYQLDDNTIQPDPVFTNVSSGMHRVTVYDTNGCSVVTISIRVINYPHYFTPNGDGYHDFWNIGDLVNDPNAKIYIFDRYGKLLRQIKPSRSSGWNGKLNGKPLPSTDYWFTATYTEEGVIKEFKSHFSLKR